LVLLIRRLENMTEPPAIFLLFLCVNLPLNDLIYLKKGTV